MGQFNQGEEMEEQMALYFEGLEDIKEQDQEYMKKKCQNVLEHLEEIDGLLNEYSKGWKTKRMSRVDLAALRLAVYEIRFDEDVPTGVAINEAVELAKAYGGEASRSFVNGILGRVASEIEKTVSHWKNNERDRGGTRFFWTGKADLLRRTGEPLCKKYVYSGLFSPEGLCKGRSVQL